MQTHLNSKDSGNINQSTVTNNQNINKSLDENIKDINKDYLNSKNMIKDMER